MRVLYDFQILCMQRFGGISRYFCELTGMLSKKKDYEYKFNALFPINYYYGEQTGKNTLEEYPHNSGKLVRQLNRMRMSLPFREKYDIVHPTYFDPYIIGKYSGKLVVTVYDMIGEKFPELFANAQTEISNKRKMIFAADIIIAISESTKRDILAIYPQINEEKIKVIYIGSSMKAECDEEMKKRLPEHYVLFVGNRDKYKNFIVFTEAMKEIFREHKDMRAVCVGGGSFTEEEKNRMDDMKDHFVQINCFDKELSTVYMQAECFVFPSKYEGFGIPVLEAFECGCPTILSNASSLPEVGGDAALYFDPMSKEELTECLGRLLRDEELREELRSKGRKRLEMFSWESIAEETYKVYVQALEDHC